MRDETAIIRIYWTDNFGTGSVSESSPWRNSQEEQVPIWEAGNELCEAYRVGNSLWTYDTFASTGETRDGHVFENY